MPLSNTNSPRAIRPGRQRGFRAALVLALLAVLQVSVHGHTSPGRAAGSLIRSRAQYLYVESLGDRHKNLPPLDGPFDNWAHRFAGDARLACEDLKLELGTMYLPKEIAVMVWRKLYVFRVNHRHKYPTSLHIQCAPARQDQDHMRCFSDLGSYVTVGRALVPRVFGKWMDTLVEGKGIPLSISPSGSRLHSLLGHNAVQCQVRVGPRQGASRRDPIIAAFRVQVLYPEAQDIIKYIQSPRKRDFTMPAPKSPGVSAVLRSLTMRPSVVMSSASTIVEDIPEFSVDKEEVWRKIEFHQKVKEYRLVKNKHWSSVYDTLLGRYVGIIENTRLVCQKWALLHTQFQASLAVPRMRRSFSHSDPFLKDNKDKYNRYKRVETCPLILAHRAVSSPSASEGSLHSAQELAQGHTADGIEIDVFLVGATGKLVVSHDNDLSRIAGLHLNLQTLLKDKGQAALHVQRMTGCPLLAPLEQFLDIGLKFDKFKYDLELKPGSPIGNPFSGYRTKIGRAMGELLRTPKYRPLWQRDQVVITSFDSKKTEAVNAGHQDTIRTARARHKGVVAWIAHAILNNRFTKDPKATAVIMHHSLINKKRVDGLHAMGKSVGTYTIYDNTKKSSHKSHDLNEIRRIIDAGVDWIETDDPVKLRSLLPGLAGDRCADLAFYQRHSDYDSLKLNGDNIQGHV